MEITNCLYCNRKIYKKFPGVAFCTIGCQKIALNTNPKYYFNKINKMTKEDLKQQKKLLKCLSDHKVLNKKIAYERNTHVIRKITASKDRKNVTYGITLPRSIWKKYKRYHCKHLVNGIIVLIPQKTKQNLLASDGKTPGCKPGEPSSILGKRIQN